MTVVQAVSALVQHGASVSAQIMGSSQTPWLSRGSTALHIAAARGSHTVAQALLEAQGQEPGVLLVQQRCHGVQLSVMPSGVALSQMPDPVSIWGLLWGNAMAAILHGCSLWHPAAHSRGCPHMLLCHPGAHTLSKAPMQAMTSWVVGKELTASSDGPMLCA